MVLYYGLTAQIMTQVPFLSAVAPLFRNRILLVGINFSVVNFPKKGVAIMISICHQQHARSQEERGPMVLLDCHTFSSALVTAVEDLKHLSPQQRSCS
jgi:hypothetical protein